jgi:hypothetical protein
MPLFDNPFYSDDDCKMVYKTRPGWGFESFERERLNRSAAYRSLFSGIWTTSHFAGRSGDFREKLRLDRSDLNASVALVFRTP